MRRTRIVTSLCCALAALYFAVVAPASAFDILTDQQNFSKTQERQTIYLTPQYTLLLTKVSTQNEADSLAAGARDPQRNFHTNVCARADSGCAGDARLYDWE